MAKKKSKSRKPQTPQTQKGNAPLNQQSRNLDSAKILLAIALAAVIFLGWWRTSSRPLRAVLGTDRFTAAAVVRRENAAGTPVIRTWTARIQSGPELDALTELLDSSRYRTDLGNLSLLQSGAGGSVYPSGTAYYTLEVTLTGEDGQDRTLLFTDSKTLWTGDRRFHPTDRDLMARVSELADHIMSEQAAERGHSQEGSTVELPGNEPTEAPEP